MIAPPHLVETRPRNHNRSQSSDGLLLSKFRPEQSPTKEEEHFRLSVEKKSQSAIASNKARVTRMFSLTPATPTETIPTSSSTNSFFADNTPPLVPIPSHQRSVSEVDSSGFTSHSGRRTAMIRKKSGELVRSSLKMGETTPLDTSSITRSPKSAPATPSAKYVHFDTQLEHVKLFLAQQKPAAVSRQGSPTLETETEDEAFPFPAMSTAQPGLLSLRLPNFPSPVNVDQDAFLESLEIAVDGKSLRGVVRVKNLAFSKHVAIRFTLDNWMTVSEVSCDYLQAFSATVDRFVFGIKLQDLLARIEEKTMFVAVRYTVDGREIWDNNGGANYRVEFKKERPLPTPVPRTTTVITSRKPAWTAQAQELRKELESLVQEEVRESRQETKSFTDGSPTATAFSSRYDFHSSFTASGTSKNGRVSSLPKSSPVIGGGRGLPYSSLLQGPSQINAVNAPEVADNFSSNTHDYSKSNPITTSSRYNTYPNPISAGPYSPLLPPVFRGKRSPFGSPSNLSPNPSPPRSPTASISSTISESTYIHSSPDSEVAIGDPITDSKEVDFSKFLDRYCFHQSSQSANLGFQQQPLMQDFSRTTNNNRGYVDNYYGSTNSSGATTPLH